MIVGVVEENDDINDNDNNTDNDNNSININNDNNDDNDNNDSDDDNDDNNNNNINKQPTKSRDDHGSHRTEIFQTEIRRGSCSLAAPSVGGIPPLVKFAVQPTKPQILDLGVC